MCLGAVNFKSGLEIVAKKEGLALAEANMLAKRKWREGSPSGVALL